MKILDARSVSFPRVAAGLQQSPGYARTVSEMGADIEQFVITDTRAPVARFQMLRRQMGPLKVFWVPRGPVWTPDTSMDQRRMAMLHLTDAVADKGLWLVSPDTPEDLQSRRHRVMVTPQHVAEIDLRPGPEALRAAQHGKWRNRLRHAERAGLDVTHRAFDPSRDMDVLTLENTQRRVRRYRALPPGFVLAWARANTRQTRLFTVRSGGTPMAYMLALLHRPVASYHLGWTSDAGRKASAHNLALWHMIRWLSDQRYVRLDLGTVDTENTPGLARFKIGSGAAVRSLGPSAILLPRLRRARPIRHSAA